MSIKSRRACAWQARVVAAMAAIALCVSVSPAFAQFFVPPAIGGVWVDAHGVVRMPTAEMLRDARIEMQKLVRPAEGEMARGVEMRMVSLRGLEEALARAAANGETLPDDVRYLAGLQRIEFVFLYPESNDIVLAGPAEGWRVDQAGIVVGETTGRPVIQFEDLITALRTARNAAQDEGISVSIDPSADLHRQFSTLLRQREFSPEMIGELESALGEHHISLTGVPEYSRFAQVLVAADFRMKRLAMSFDEAPIAGMPSVLDLARQRGTRLSGQISPRFWMECSYEPIRRSEDGLSWQIAGPGVKTLTEEAMAGRAAQSHPIAAKWAETMTERFTELADADPIFGNLRNIMDLAVVAALIEHHEMLHTVGLQLPTILGHGDVTVEMPQYVAPRTVPTQCSFVAIGRSWMVTASGGVQVDSWSVARNVSIQAELAGKRPATSDDFTWWCNAVATR